MKQTKEGQKREKEGQKREKEGQTESEKQERCRKIVFENVYGCLSAEVEYMLKRSLEDSDSPLSHDINTCQTDTDSLKDAILERVKDNTEEEQKELFEKANTEHNRKIKTVGDYLVFLNSLEEELKEIAEELDIEVSDYDEAIEVLEWWHISSWLAYRLEQKNEVIIESSCNCQLWGRQTSGQSIVIDKVIRELDTELQKEHRERVKDNTEANTERIQAY